MRLSKKNIGSLAAAALNLPDERIFDLPEKILQFGTGVLLRGLCDYVVNESNSNGRFNGRIVVVKSTDTGDTHAFDDQDNLYTVCVRGIDNGKIVEENTVCAAISRVLSAKHNWHEILASVRNADLKIIISNTTEVGLQLVKEKINGRVPSSFPAKLLAALHSRFLHFGNSPDGAMVVIPTELISNNGELLLSIVKELAVYNEMGEDFATWLDERIIFCNSLVDRIVTKDPGTELLNSIQKQLGYDDALLTMCEDYYLWAIEGSPEVANILSFAGGNGGAFVKPDIDIYKFLKLHLLNGTHTLSAPLAFLSGFDIVKDAMADPVFAAYVERLMLHDIARAIPYQVSKNEIENFSSKVLDRFRNPYLQHRWINITLQNTMKMRMRNIPVIIRYDEQYNAAPDCMAAGFAAYLLFMKVERKEGNSYYGKRSDEFYIVNDDQAPYFYDLWNSGASISNVVNTVLSNKGFWGSDLSNLKPFAIAVEKHLLTMLTNGVRHTISNI